jgi:DNA-binding CsgD family transcriptional regulator
MDSRLLLERERELGELGTLLDAAARGFGSLIVIEGAAGLGKSRLLAWALANADRTGLVTLSARGGEPEQSFSFGVALQLLERRLAGAAASEREELLAGAAALSLPLFEGEGGGLPEQSARDGLVHGLFWLVANLAERTPVLLAVDDLHWADEPSLRFLLYLVRRLEALPVALLATRRPADGGPLDGELADDPLARRIALAPLSAAAVARLLEGALGENVEQSFAASAHHATGGNPFLVRAMSRSLVEEGVAPADANAARIAELRPDEVRRQVLTRIAQRGEEAVALASAAAIVGEGGPLSHAAAVAGLDLDAAERAADSLIAADVLSAAAPLGFVHPLLGAAVYEEVPAARRGRWHARAAELLHEDHAPAEQVAAQLLPGARVGEPWAGEALREAAERELRAGSPESASRLLARALEEPLARDERAAALSELARAKAMLGEDSAELDLERALELIEDSAAKAKAHRTLGGVLYTRGETARAAREFERGLALLDDPEDPLARELHAAYFSAASLVPELAPRAIEHIQPLLDRPPGDEGPAERGALAAAAVHLAVSGAPHARAIALAERAWADGRLLAEEGPDGWAWSLVTGAFGWTDELEASLDVCGRVIEEARRHGSLMAYATASFCAVQPLHMMGRLATARASAEAAHDARRQGWRTFPAALAATFARVLIDQGEMDEAERELAVLADPGYGTPPGRAWALAVRGRLRLLQARPQEALEDLVASGAIFAQIAGPDDSWATWRTDAALAAAQTGDREQADELLADAGRIAEQTGAATQRAEVLRARARLAGVEERAELLAEAIAALESSQAQTERLRCLAELGGALRRRGRRAEARAKLTEALEEAHRIGARRIERLAHEELKVAGARPRRLAFSGTDSLTASERRVAEMAAEGLANREIAQALFVTPRTVEQHLYNTYKKLGIKSRKQLPTALR